MFRHNLLIAYRSFLRNKSSFLINLIGLSTGLACVLLIYLWVHDEMRVDKFHEKDAQLYQVMFNITISDEILTWENTPFPLGEALMDEFPEVEVATFANYSFFPKVKIAHEGNSLDVASLFIHARFFDVFSYDLIHGNSQEPFSTKEDILLSDQLALKLFNSTEDLIGKTIDFDVDGINRPLQIAGIFLSPPINSTAQFDVLISAEMMLELDPPSKEWFSTAGETYLVLKEGTDLIRFNEKIENYGETQDESMKGIKLFAQQYSQKYLHGQYENGRPVGGRIEYIRYFFIIALFILLIACINFMNLSTAQASRKMKEIGVKKTIGASRQALLLQFLSESMIMVLLSLLAALGWVLLLLPKFNEVNAKSIELNLDANVILSIIGIALATGLLAGSYPAFYLSAFKPVSTLKGKRRNSSGEYWVRKGLVIFQFSLSVIFILGVLVVDQQLQYTQTKNMGYSRDNVISFQRPSFQDDVEILLSKLRSLPGVERASNMARNIMTATDDQAGYSWRGQESDNQVLFKSPQIGYELIETLGMEILQGRSYSREFSDEGSKMIINESARKLMQLEDPIGKKVAKGDGFQEIIGVVSDFHYGSLHHEVKPLIFRFRPFGLSVVIKLKEGMEKNTIEQIRKTYQALFPDNTFAFTFLDEDNQRLYEAENRVAVLSKYFAGLAILISCLGLLGLSMFTTEARKKEIGIRKVLGSSEFGIVQMLTRDFTKIVLIAIALSLPLSYLVAREWLSNFAYTFDLNIWLFLMPGFLVLLLAWATVGFQTLRAARLRPVHSLRDE